MMSRVLQEGAASLRAGPRRLGDVTNAMVPSSSKKPYKEKRKVKKKFVMDEDQPVKARDPADVCNMKGEVRARYGLSIDHGAAVKARWAYAPEHVESCHALEATYQCWRSDNTYKFKGSFVDDPVLYGAGVRRVDTMTLTWAKDSLVTGDGFCDFYGPYVVDGTMHVTEDRRRATFTLRKRDPSKVKVEGAEPITWDSDGEDELPQVPDDPPCEDNCRCRQQQRPPRQAAAAVPRAGKGAKAKAAAAKKKKSKKRPCYEEDDDDDDDDVSDSSDDHYDDDSD
mmetsp:Transcript_8007/g.26314  ORF Transcript_8007/g.26314 Transcript_8007/m.26314 type:complete len:282 (-) Transcript_8007:8-853(-)